MLHSYVTSIYESHDLQNTIPREEKDHSEKGEGVQKRCLQMSPHGIEGVDQKSKIHAWGKGAHWAKMS